MKVLMFGLVLVLVTGCTNRHKVFGSQQAKLEISSCLKCHKKMDPFYVDGEWQEVRDV